MATRSKTSNSIFGQPAEFITSMIPSKADVFKHYIFVMRREQVLSKGTTTSRQCYRIVAQDIQNIWDKFSFPYITHEGVCLKVESLIEAATKINKIPISRRNEEFHENVRAYDQMFDICTCNCYDKNIKRQDCRCNIRIPFLEWDAFVGQKERKCQLGPIDRSVTGARRRTQEKSERLRLQSDNNRSMGRGRGIPIDDSVPSCSREVNVDNVESEMMEVEEPNNDYDFQPEYELLDNIQNRFTYPNLSITADRYRVSCRAAAAIVNAALKDMGILNETNMLDRNKVNRERQRFGKENVQTMKSENTKLECIGFDGRKDRTKKREGMEDEEHYVLVKEPFDIYMTHVTPDNGRARSIADEIITFIIDSNSNDSIKALLCDGTPVNTGRVAGVIKLTETYLEKPLQWLICLLHANELPFRHVFLSIDGKTSGPKTSEGVIGRKIQEDLTKLEIVQFVPVSGNVPEVPLDIAKEFSTDQKYLFDICTSIKSGHISSSLAKKSPGTIHHARWLTKANRILRLYVSTDGPCQTLRDLVHIIMNVYAPGWFRIKSHPKASDGAPNFWYLTSLLKTVENKYAVIMQRVLRNNSYFANPENILLAMMADTRREIRELAIQRIFQARKQEINVRNFELPKTLNFNADDYSKMIDWNNEHVTEPPILKDYGNAELLKMKNKPLQRILIPCHSQGIERAVHLVTQASEHKIGYENRHKFIVNTLQSRKALPEFNWKGQWQQ